MQSNYIPHTPLATWPRMDAACQILTTICAQGHLVADILDANKGAGMGTRLKTPSLTECSRRACSRPQIQPGGSRPVGTQAKHSKCTGIECTIRCSWLQNSEVLVESIINDQMHYYHAWHMSVN